MNKKVAVIIVTYNRCELLKECIESIRQQTYSNYDIIVVNNGSTDNTLEWLSTQSDIITITQSNSGGAGGFSTGLKYSCEHEYSYSWVMDDDVVADNNALLALMIRADKAEGFLCSRVLDTNGELCNVPRLSKKKSTTSSEYVWGNKLDYGMIRVDIASFVSVLLNNKIIFDIGLPYKEYFIWGDDTEYTSRISKFLASYMVIDSKVIHKRKIQSALSIFKECDKKRCRNYFFLYRNRIHLQPNKRMKMFYVAYSLYDAIKLLFTGQVSKGIIIIKAVLSYISFSPSIYYPIQKC